jgi:hypothetical protein
MKISFQPIRYSIILSLRASALHLLPSVNGFYQVRPKITKSDYQLRQVFLYIRSSAITIRLTLDNFSRNLTCIFRKSVAKIQGSLKFDKNKRVLYMKTNLHFLLLSRSILLRMINFS